MKATRRLLLISLGCCMVVASVLAIAGLFVMRFQAGDVYPGYSTLRADPIGTRVLYESIQAAGLADVRRNIRNIRDVELTPDTVLFFLGDDYPVESSHMTIPKDLSNHLFRFVNEGGRMVITLRPYFRFSDEEDSSNEEDLEEEDAEEEDAGEETTDTGACGGESCPSAGCKTCQEERGDVRVTEWFGATAMARPGIEPGTEVTLSEAYVGSGLPRSMQAYTSLCFTNTHTDWQVVYESDGVPLIMERNIGQGSIVLSAMGYCVSNEAMRDDLQPRLLAWLIGNRTRALFDEVHLGIAEQPGVASLIRRYRLFGAVAACLLVALLWIWQNAIPLVPASATRTDGGGAVTADRDSTAGYISLLRRSIPLAGVLEVCVKTWRESAPTTLRQTETLDSMVDDLSLSGRHPSARGKTRPEIYNEITSLVGAVRHGKAPAEPGNVDSGL